MRYLSFLYPALLASCSLWEGADALRSGNKIKLSNVKSLTLRKGLKTSHRRVSAIPQLKCIGGSAKGLYEIDVMRCQNSGSEYDSEDIQWTCKASIPEDFKLGSTDVICEGYDSPEDPYVLKGSCGVEYRLILTRKGEERYGKKKWWDTDDRQHPKTMGERIAAMVFWVIFIGVAGFIVYSWIMAWLNNQNNAGAGRRPGWGGGGGGWGGSDDDDPPPPYDWRPSPKPRSSTGYGTNQGWRPGFWSGAFGGAAAGYAAGRAGNWGNQRNSGGGNTGGGSWWNNGEGSSRSSSGSSSSSAGSSARYESTGFGSTSRR